MQLIPLEDQAVGLSWTDKNARFLSNEKEDENEKKKKPKKKSPTYQPTKFPTAIPSLNPTIAPTSSPTSIPTADPTAVPTSIPTAVPTALPTATPTSEPTAAPTSIPTAEPTALPTATPTSEPTAMPTSIPTADPTAVPTAIPTADPTAVPTAIPTADPTAVPTSIPTSVPTTVPTAIPTSVPTAVPTSTPTSLPSSLPTSQPTLPPTLRPTPLPTPQPTAPHTGYAGVANPGSIPIVYPYLGINFVIALTGVFPPTGRRLGEINATTLADVQQYSHRRLGDDRFVGEIFAFGGNFAPVGFAFCQGQLIPIQQNTALFSLLGTYYGGNGVSNFALPDLQSRVTVSAGQGAGLSQYDLGETTGVEHVTLTVSNLPSHLHSLPAGSNTQSTGSNVPLSLIQPTLTINYIISLYGVFPSPTRRLHESTPSDSNTAKFYVQGSNPYVGEIALFAGNFAPANWLFCNGQTLPIAGNDALYNLIGKTFLWHMYDICYYPYIKCLFLALVLFLYL